MKTSKWLVACVVLSLVPAFADDEAVEENVELTPFVIQADSEGYAPVGMSRTRVTNVDNSPAPGVPITIVKRADSVAVQVLLKNENDKPELRNRELFQTVSALDTAAKAAGFTVEQRQVQFSSAERKFASFSKGNVTSQVNLVVIAPLGADKRVADIVKAVRDLVNEKMLVGKTRVADGTVGLVLKDPGQYRRELLTKIFEDVEFLKKGIGPDFEVKLTGLSRQILMRPSGEGSLELWIDYSFLIASIREINAKK